MPSVTVEISSGPTITVPWVAGMNAKQAYSLQFYGSTFGYLVSMVNETYDTFFSSSDPFFYWAFYVNGNIAPKGIDSTILKQGDVVMFQYQLYDPNQHAASQLGIKHQLHQQAAAKDS
jgi:hypothetical protein